MENTYYDPKDLDKFGDISEFQPELAKKFFSYYNDVFKESGLIPTSAEERAKSMAALEGEIERQIKLIEGVLDVQVQIVQPEESALRTNQNQIPPTTASVAVKYLEGEDGSRPMRGTTQAQVESKFGSPVSKKAAVGDPPISRWEYQDFTVYFEYDRVIHAVLKR